MRDRSELEKRYAVAQAEQAAAEAARDQAVSRESEDRLRRLKKQSVERRFAALADPDLGLTAAHRRELVASIRGTAVMRPTVGVATASWWEVWRSRLRYRLFSVSVTAAAVVTIAILAVVSNHRTPLLWARIVSAGEVTVGRIYPSGQIVPYALKPGGRYAVLKITQDQVLLRDWEPGSGYSTFWIQGSLLAPD